MAGRRATVPLATVRRQRLQIRVRSLALRADGADLAVGGNAWVLKDGQPLGEDLLTRLRQQPYWWALLLLVDGLLLAWTLLVLLPGPRRIELRGVFISYRRADSGPQVGRLHDRLVAQLGAERVFLDLESIPAGEDFDRFITDSLARVDIVLAVIGPHWLDVAGHERTPPAGCRGRSGAPRDCRCPGGRPARDPGAGRRKFDADGRALAPRPRRPRPAQCLR